MSDQTDTLDGRLPFADPTALNPAQREIFERVTARIVPWANDAHFQSTAEDGRFIGPLKPALRNPASAAPFLDLQFGDEVYARPNKDRIGTFAEMIAINEESASPRIDGKRLQKSDSMGHRIVQR
jgi:hypothetical protein